MLRNQLIALRSSDAVDVMFANPLNGTVDILFQTGHAYTYTNVSRRAIVNLIPVSYTHLRAHETV